MLLPESQRLLKANAAREIGARVAFNFEDIHQQGDAYLKQVREQAEALIRKAQQEADALREAARKEAHEQGRRDGLKDSAGIIEQQSNRLVEQRMKERVETALPAVAAAAQAMRQELDRWLIRWEETAVRTAVAIAEKLIHRQLETRPDVAAGMIAETLRLAAGHPQLRVHLHPEDIAHLGTHAEVVVRSATSCAEAVVVPDAAITRGGCRIETRHGEIDARLETMLDRIVEELLA
jgi:flagellar assembly protein FliH